MSGRDFARFLQPPTSFQIDRMFMQAEQQWREKLGDAQIDRFIAQEGEQLELDQHFCSFIEGIASVAAEYESSTDYS